MNKKKTVLELAFVMLFLCSARIAVSQTPAATANPSFVAIETKYVVVNSIDNGAAYLNKHFQKSGDLTPIIMTYVDNDGSVSICSADKYSKAIYIYEYTKDLVHIKTMQFQTPFNKFGAFTKDNDGNYYIFSAEDVPEGAHNQNNMALVKYNSEGRQIAIFNSPAKTTDGFYGIKSPFATGSCRMEISGDWIAVYFAREMFIAEDGLNHQASYGFMLNKNNLERIPNNTMPYVSHSFNQYILPIDNGFVFVDQGDSYPRGFCFTRIQNGRENKKITPFNFKKGKTYQNTFSQLGGLVKTPNGYLFAGTYERDPAVTSEQNDSRNLFVLTFDDELNNISEPVWITNYRYKNKENAANAKIIALNSGRYLLMWELIYSWSYRSTYMTIIDEKGKRLKPIKEIGRIHLNINDTLGYNRTTGNVYWAVNNGSFEIIIYTFNPDKPIKIKKSS